MSDFETLLKQLQDQEADGSLTDYVRNNPVPTANTGSETSYVDLLLEDEAHRREMRSPTTASSVNQPIDVTLDSAIAKAKRNIQDYTSSGRYDIGTRVTDYIVNYGTQVSPVANKQAYSRAISNASGRDLTKQIVMDAYQKMPTQDRDYLVNLAYNHFAAKNDDETSSFITRRMGTPERESELLAATIDYVVDTGDASNDLLTALKTSKFIQDKPSLPQPENPVKDKSHGFFGGIFNSIGNALSSLFQDNTQTSGTAANQFQKFINDSDLDKFDNGMYTTLALQDSTDFLKQFGNKDTLTKQEINNTRTDILRSLPENQGNENYYIMSLEPETILAMRRIGEFHDLNTRTFLEALMVTPSDAGMNSIIKPHIGDAPAHDHWKNLGLSTQQQRMLQHTLRHGGKTGISGQIVELAREGDKKKEAEAAVKKWLEEQGARYKSAGRTWPPDRAMGVPREFTVDGQYGKYLTDDFLVRQGFEPRDPNHWYERIWVLSGLVRYGFGWPLRGLIWADEYAVDGIYRALSKDPMARPAQNMGHVRDMPWNRYHRKKINITGGDFSSKPNTAMSILQSFSPNPLSGPLAQQGLTNYVGKYLAGKLRPEDEEAQKHIQRTTDPTMNDQIDGAIWGYFKGLHNINNWVINKIPYIGKLYAENMPSVNNLEASKYNITKSFEEAFPNLSAPDLDFDGTFAGYMDIETRLVAEDSREGGKIRTDYAYIYEHIADDNERLMIQDAGGGLFEMHWQENRTLHYPNMADFNRLVLEENYSIPDAIDEAVNMAGHIRAGWQMSILAPLDLGGGLVGKALTKSGLAARSAPRLIRASKGLNNFLSVVGGKSTVSYKNAVRHIEDLTSRLAALTETKNRKINSIIVTSGKNRDLPIKPSSLWQEFIGKGTKLSRAQVRKALLRNPVFRKLKDDADRLRKKHGEGVGRIALDPDTGKPMDMPIAIRKFDDVVEDIYAILRGDLDYEMWSKNLPEYRLNMVDEGLALLSDETYEVGFGAGQIPVGQIEEVASNLIGIRKKELPQGIISKLFPYEFVGRIPQAFRGRYTVGRGDMPSDVATLDKEIDEITKLLHRLQEAVDNARGQVPTEIGGTAPAMGPEFLDEFEFLLDTTDLDPNILGKAVTLADQYIDLEYSIKNVFTLARANRANLALATLNKANDGMNKFGPELVEDLVSGLTEGTQPDRDGMLVPLIDAGKLLKRWLFAKTGQGPMRDAVQTAAQTTLREFTGILLQFQEQYKYLTAPETIVYIRGMMNDLQKVKDHPVALLHWLIENKIDDVLHLDRARAMDILRQIDLDKVRSLKNLPENEDALPRWKAEFNQEIIREVTKVLMDENHFNLAEDATGALAIQNQLNSFASRIFLARPSFVIRNWSANKALMALSGTPLSDATSITLARFNSLFNGVEFATRQQPSRSTGTSEASLGPIRGESVVKQMFDVAVGSRDEKVLSQRSFVKRLARRAYGDGLFPGFGGTPFFYARQLSGFVESVDRRNIVDKATFRFYRRMSNPEMLRRILAERAPAALSILDEKDPSGTLMREILEHFQNPTVLTDQDLIRVVQTLVDVDDQIKFSIGVPKSPATLLREAGFDVHGLQDADIDMLLKPLMDDMINHTGQAKKTIKDPATGEEKEVIVPEPLAASHALQQAIEQLIGDVYERARKVAIVAGLDVSEELERARHVEQRVLDGQADDIFDLSPEELQNELHSRLFEVYDSVFTQVKTYLSGGNEAALTESQVEAAHGYALQAMMSASKAIRDMEEARLLIRETINDPEAYLEARYGYLRELFNIMDEPDLQITNQMINDRMKQYGLKQTVDPDQIIPPWATPFGEDGVPIEGARRVTWLELPNELYHVTSRGSAIDERKGILAVVEDNHKILAGGGLGGPINRNVSTTTSRQAAENLELEMGRRVDLFNTPLSRVVALIKKYAAEDRARAGITDKNDPIVSSIKFDTLQLSESEWFKRVTERLSGIRKQIRAREISVDEYNDFYKTVDPADRPAYSEIPTKDKKAIINLREQRESILLKDEILAQYYEARDANALARSGEALEAGNPLVDPIFMKPTYRTGEGNWARMDDNAYADALLAINKDDIKIITIPKETISDNTWMVANDTEALGEIQIFSDVAIMPPGGEQISILPDRPTMDWLSQVQEFTDVFGYQPIERLIDDALGILDNVPLGLDQEDPLVGVPITMRDVPQEVQEAADRVREILSIMRMESIKSGKIVEENELQSFGKLKFAIQKRLKEKMQGVDFDNVPDSVKGNIIRETLTEIIQHRNLVHLGEDIFQFNAKTISSDFLTKPQRSIFTDEIINAEINDMVDSGDLVRFTLKAKEDGKYAWIDPDDIGDFDNTVTVVQPQRFTVDNRVDGVWQKDGRISAPYTSNEANAPFNQPLSKARMTKLMYEFAENVEILANRATMLKLSDPSLAQKSAKLDSDLKRIANNKIDNIKALADDLLGERQDRPFRGSIPSKEAKERLEEFRNAVEESFQGTGKDGQTKGFVEDAAPRINNLLVELGFSPIELDLRKNGQHLADRVGRSVSHNQDVHAYERWMTEWAPKMSFLKKLNDSLKQDLKNAIIPTEIDPTLGIQNQVRGDSLAITFVEAIRRWDEAQSIRAHGFHLDTELDAELIRSINRNVVIRNLPEDLRQQEFYPSKGIFNRGIPRANTWDDVISFAQEYNLEQHIPLQAITKGVYRRLENGKIERRQSKRTLSVPLWKISTPEGQTKDISETGDTYRRGRIVSPAQEWIATQATPWQLGNNGYYRGDAGILPAQFGFGAHRRTDGTLLEDIPAQGINGRVFMQNAPAGYKPFITDDTWANVDGTDCRKIGIFVKEGATEEDITAGVLKLARYRDDLRKNAKKLGWDFRQESRGQYNWTGFQASWSGITGELDLVTPEWAYPETVISELQKVIKQVEDLSNPESSAYKDLVKQLEKEGIEGRAAIRTEISLRRRALKDIGAYMVEQWQKGFPIYGDSRNSLEDVLPIWTQFKRSSDATRRARGRAQGALETTALEGPMDAKGFFDYEKSRPIDLFEVSLTKQEADEVVKGLEELSLETNRMRRRARKYGESFGDWILHDYSNTNNLDYLIRWLGPWHIWQTRTFGKTAISLVENPALLSYVSHFLTTNRDINREREVSQWQEEEIPIGMLLEPFVSMAIALGADENDAWLRTVKDFSESATLNVDAIAFFNDQFDYFPTAGRIQEGDDPIAQLKQYGPAGKAAELWTGGAKMTLNPLFIAALGLTGQYGPDYDFEQRFIKPLTRQGDVALGIIDKLIPWKMPSQMIRTNSDKRKIHNEYLQQVITMSFRHGPESEEVEELTKAWREFGVTQHKGIVNIPLLHWMNGPFGQEYDNPIHIEVVKSANRKSNIRNATSVLAGFPLNIGYRMVVDPETGKEFTPYDYLTGYYAILKKNISKGAKDKELSAYFEKHPYVREYTALKKLGGDAQEQVNSALATSMRYDFIDENRRKRQVELDNLRVDIPTASMDNPMANPFIMSNPELQASLSIIQKAYDDADTENMIEIFNLTGINTGLPENKYGVIHPNHKADKRQFGNPKLFYDIIEENLYSNDMFMTIFADDPAAGVVKIKDIIDLAHQGSVFKGFDVPEVEQAIKELNDNRRERYGVGAELDLNFITVGMLNGFLMQNHIQSIRNQRDQAVPKAWSEEFRNKYTIDGYNVADWPQWYKDKQEWENKFKSENPEEYQLFKVYEASNASLEYIIDEAIEDLMQEPLTAIATVFTNTDNAILISERITAIEQMWLPPDADDVMRWLLENEHGNVWMQHNDYSMEELQARIDERLTTVTDITLADMRDGKNERKVSRLRSDLALGVDEKEQRHFWAPNQESIIYDEETLDEFEDAMKFKTNMDELRAQGLPYIGLEPATNMTHRNYVKYYRDDHETFIAQSTIVNKLYEAGEYEAAKAARELFKQRNRYDQNISDYIPVDVDDYGNPTTGLLSSGNTAENVGRRYKIFDLGENPAMSSAAQNMRTMMINRFYRDKSDVPGNLIFEHFARNGVSDRTSIEDMWETLYPRLRSVYPDMADMPAIKSLLTSTGEDGIAGKDAQIATFQYIDALSSLVAKVNGVAPINQRAYRTVVPQRSRQISQTSSPTTSGAGGLPTWDDVEQHIDTVFRDPSFKQALIQYLMSTNTRLSKNHERILRAMHRTFPIGTGYTFAKWIQALKLIYQTKTLVGVGTGDRGRNPTFSYPSNVPRLAKRRE